MNVPVPVPSVVWFPVTTGLAVVAQQTPFAVIDEPPSVMITPPDVAVVIVMADAAVVVKTAFPGVNTMSFPLVVPSLLMATSRK